MVCCCTNPETHQAPSIPPPRPLKQEASPAVNGSCVCAGLPDQAKRAQRMQSSINIISTAQAVVDSLSKDKQQISSSLSLLEISAIFHTAESCAQVTLPHVATLNSFL